jgi:hypothetical protein
MNNFTKYLEKENINFKVEFIIPTEKPSQDKVDVIVFGWKDIFLFEIKSGDEISMDDIQQVKRHLHLMKKPYPNHDIWQFIVLKPNMKEKYLEFRNLFRGLNVVFLDENNSVCDISNKNLNDLIKAKIGKFAKIIYILRSAILNIRHI